MTTPPIVSITDELIAELDEQLCGPEFYMVEMPMGHMRALLAERAELKRDAERWRACESVIDEVNRRANKEHCLADKCDFTVTVTYEDYADLDAALSA